MYQQAKLQKRTILVVMIAVTAMAVVVIAGGRASSIKGSAVALAPEPQVPDSKRATLIRIFVHEFDLYPDLIRITPGKVLIRAENEKRAEIALVLERIGPGQSRQHTTRVSAAHHVRRADREITLGVGEYVFYEESQPALKGTLIVDPQ